MGHYNTFVLNIHAWIVHTHSDWARTGDGCVLQSPECHASKVFVGETKVIAEAEGDLAVTTGLSLAPADLQTQWPSRAWLPHRLFCILTLKSPLLIHLHVFLSKTFSIYL